MFLNVRKNCVCHKNKNCVFERLNEAIDIIPKTSGAFSVKFIIMYKLFCKNQKKYVRSRNYKVK